MTYQGTELKMSDVEQLVASELRQAQTLLYGELLFGVGDLVPMHSWRMSDDLDLEDAGASWLTCTGDAEFAESVEVALLRRIQGSTGLRGRSTHATAKGEATQTPRNRRRNVRGMQVQRETSCNASTYQLKAQ